MSKPKAQKKLVIILASLIFVLASSVFAISTIDWNHQIGAIFQKRINNRLHKARFDFKGFAFQSKGAQLALSFDEMLIIDRAANPIIQAQNLKLDIDLSKLLAFKIKLDSVFAETLKVRAVRDRDLKWNLAELFKDKGRLFSLRFGEFNFSDIDLEVIDELSSKQVDYEALHLGIKPELGHYNINIETQETANNYVRAFGMIPRSKRKKVLDKESKLKVKIINLEPLSINLITALLVSNPELSKRIDNYVSGSSLSVNFDYDNYEKGGKLLRVKSRIANLEDIDELLFESWAHIDKDIQFDKTYLNFDETDLELSGSIKNWRESDAELALKLGLQDLNLFELVDRFPELEYYIPSFILEIFNILHGNDYLNGHLDFASSPEAPDLSAKLKINASKKRLLSTPDRKIVPMIINQEKEITAKLHYEGSKILVREFNLPIDYSTVSVKGDYDLDEHSFKINLATEDLPLVKLAPIAAQVPFFKRYRTAIARSTIVGYASMDLDIIRSLDAQRQLGTEVRGSCGFGELSYRSLDYPLIFKDINASFDINGDEIRVNDFAANIVDPKLVAAESQNYIEAKGGFNLAKENLAKLEIISPKIDAQVLLDSGLIALLSDQIVLDSASGSFQDLLLNLDSNGQDLDLDFNMNIEAVNLMSRNQSINDLEGQLSYKQDRLNFDDLSFSLNESSFLRLDGSVDKDFRSPYFSFKAKELNFVDVMNLINGSNFGVEALAGSLDANLDFLNEEINGSLALDHIALMHKDLDKYPITDLNGDVQIGKNLQMTKLSVDYGPSQILELNGQVENYRSDDIDRNLDLWYRSIFNVDDFYELMPSSMQKFIKVSGSFPVKGFVKGNKLKREIRVNADMDQADEFIFGDWFVMDKEAGRFKIISDFTLTPQLISSSNSRLVFIEDASTGPVKTKIRSKFHIEDYANKDELSYFVNFTTNETRDGKANLGFVEPHIVALQPLNLNMDEGDLSCDTYGNARDRQTICEFMVAKATAEKYGIGDLNAKDISVDLLSIAHEPLDVHVELFDGDWNTIPYNKIKFDLNANGDYIYIRDIRARTPDGIARGELDYNYKTLDSKFKIDGRDLSAHDLVQGIWGFGTEVPEGLVSGTFEGTTTGYMPEPMFNNLEATANLILKNGKLSQLILMQKVLTAVNTLHNFDLNNIFQTLVTYKGGTFDHIISSINYDHGIMSSKKLLLKASQMELNLNGYFDYNKDQLWVKGKGLIPKKSKSILQSIGVGKLNLGNLLSMDDLSEGGSKEKRFFDFLMAGPISDPDKSAESLKSNFTWR